MSSAVTLTDMFCGCGGSSQGAKMVAGVEVKLALNHWRLAVESHNTNHPNTDHDCADVSETHPARYGRTTGLIASPECTNHSIAKGQRRKNLAQGDFFQQKMIDPSAVRSRATMWDVVRFAEIHRYEFIVTENVVDVRDWELWEPWLRSMHALGYQHECVYLNAMFAHGAHITGFAPQSRDRIYIVFWKKGNPKPDLRITPSAPCGRCARVVEAIQVFKPNGSHKARYKTQYVYRCPSCTHEVTPYYYAALNCLDLTLPMGRIGDRATPLSPKTMARIEYGLKKFGLTPTLVDLRNGSGSEKARLRTAAGDVLNTQSTGYSSYLFAPFLFNMSHSASAHGGYVKDTADPLHTQTTQQSTALALPAAAMLTMRGGRSLGPLDDAMPTQVAAGIQNWLLSAQPLAGFLSPQYGNPGAALLTGVAPAVTTTNKSALILLPYHGGSHQAHRATDAAPTIATNDGLSLVATRPAIEDCYFRMLQPEETARAQGFPTDYIILGNKDERQRQVGNANPPPTMELLVQRCVASLEGKETTRA